MKDHQNSIARQQTAFVSYFREALQILEEEARVFGEVYPGQCVGLGRESFSCDSEVLAKLLGSFAYLGAKINQRLDSYEGLIALNAIRQLWPDAFSPIPVSNVIQLDGKDIPWGTIVPQGCQFKTEKGIKFNSITECSLNPLSIKNIELKESLTPQLMLTFNNENKRVAIDDHASLVLFVDSTSNAGSMLKFFLIEYVEEIHVKINDDEVLMERDCLNPLTFKGAHAAPLANLIHNLLNPSLSSFFCLANLPMRFLNNLQFSVTFTFSKPWPSFYKISNLIYINCIPVTNLYEKDSTPFVYNNHELRYPLCIEPNELLHSIKKIVSRVPGDTEDKPWEDATFGNSEKLLRYTLYKNRLHDVCYDQIKLLGHKRINGATVTPTVLVTQGVQASESLHETITLTTSLSYNLSGRLLGCVTGHYAMSEAQGPSQQLLSYLLQPIETAVNIEKLRKLLTNIINDIPEKIVVALASINDLVYSQQLYLKHGKLKTLHLLSMTLYEKNFSNSGELYALVSNLYHFYALSLCREGECLEFSATTKPSGYHWTFSEEKYATY